MSKNTEEMLSELKLSQKIRVLYSYSLADMPSSKKVRFVYLMKGRKSEMGLVENFKGEYVSSSAFIIPLSKDAEMIEVLGMWGVEYKRRKILLID
jgi:hypothetical protein